MIVLVHGIELASATNTSSSLVIRKVATAALDALQGNPDFMSRTCDCKTSQDSKRQFSSAQLGYEDAEGTNSRGANGEPLA